MNKHTTNRQQQQQVEDEEKEAIASVQNLCHVDESRARRLVQEAHGSVEQAVALHFHDHNTAATTNFKSIKQISEIQTVCNVSVERAHELWKASNESLERAIDMHFSTATSRNKVSKSNKPTTATSRLKKTPKRSGTKRQSTLHAFVGLPVPKVAKQRRIDSFFTKAAHKNTIPVENEQVPGENSEQGKSEREKQAKEKKEEGKEEVSDQELHSQRQDAESDKGVKTRIKQEDTEEGCAIKTEPFEPKSESVNNESATTLSTENGTPENIKSKDVTCATQTKTLPYSLLADRYALMVATTKRNAKLESLRDIFKEAIQLVGGIHMDSTRDGDAYLLTCVIDLILGKLSVTKRGTTREKTTLQVSGSAVSSAVLTVTGISRSQMRDEYRRSGDLGDVASKYFVGTSVKSFFQSTSTTSVMSVTDVHDLMQRVATVPPGKGSQAARQNILLRLLRGAQSKNEMRFLVRTLLGNMRLGATLKSVVTALAVAVDSYNDEPTSDVAETLQSTFSICPRILDISKALLEGGVSRAAEVCTLSIGHPIQPMLANPAHSLEEVDKFMGELSAVAEWKYDGVRCQAHFDGKNVTLFSRHMINNTAQYPDAVRFFHEAKNRDVESFICDAEIVGVAPCTNSEDGYRLLPFQDLSTVRGSRTGRKGDDISIRIYSYDLMFLNGESLLKEPLSKRQDLLHKSFSRTPGFGFASSVSLEKFDEVSLQESLKSSVDGGAEGLMIKLTGREYESGLRGRSWLKLKRDYLAGSADTIDVVPIGAWFGNGRKAQAGFLSPVLLAVFDEDEGAFRSISRCMSFTDAMYKATRDYYFHGTSYPSDVGISNDECAESAEAIKVAADNNGGSPYEEEEHAMDAHNENVDEDRVNCFPTRPSSATYITNENPSIWFKPLEVWEVSFADLSLSRMHTAAAGLVDDAEGRGVALRFPRFVRRRPDKDIEMATTTEQIAQLFGKQTKIVNKGRS